MDYEKPNWRPNRKTKQSYPRQITRDLMSSTLSVASVDSSHVVARGESFGTGVEYSLNKSRRWELSAHEFVPEAEASKKHKKSVKVVVARADHTQREAVESSTQAFHNRAENSRVEPEEPRPVKATSRKDRKHFRTPKPSKPNTHLSNTHTASVYAAGSADVHVAILEKPEASKVRKDYKDYTFRPDDHQARTHKNQDLTRLAL